MIPIFIPGIRCWLDGKTEVIVMKATTRSHSTYNVEIPGKSLETVAYDRLTLMEAVINKLEGSNAVLPSN